MTDSDNPERFSVGAVVYVRPARPRLAGGGESQRRRLTMLAVRGESGFPIVSFAEVADREGASRLSGFIIEVPGEDLPRLGEDEYYPFELEGLEVRDAGGSVVGKLHEVIDTPAHPLLVVRLDDEREVLVPFVSAAVPYVEIGEGYLVVDRGFLESP